MPRVAKKTAPRARAPARSYVSGRGSYRSHRYTPSRRYAVKGRGGYWDNVKSRWKSGGGVLAPAFKMAGGALGGPVGSALGGLLQKGIYALTGFGDYQIQKNVLTETNGPPAVINRSNKEFVVRHREYITDIYSASGTASTPSAFANQVFSINPGDFNTFPWLSAVADKFETYRIEGMIFEFKSLYSDAVVTQNGSIGSVILATEYNAGAAPFPNKQYMENYEFAQSCKPSHSVLHPIECARSQNVLSELYVRPGPVPSGEDVKTYDFGDFQIASQGIPLGSAGAAVALGELWVSYQIALIKPKISSAAGTYIDSGYAHFSSVMSYINTFTSVNPAPISVIQKMKSSNLSIIQSTNNTFVITLGSVPMKYVIDISWESTYVVGDIVWAAPGLTLTNLTTLQTTIPTLTNFQVPISVSPLSQSNGCATRWFIQAPAATASNPTATFVINGNGAYSPTALVRFNMFVNAIPTLAD